MKYTFDSSGFIQLNQFLSPLEMQELRQGLDNFVRDVVPLMNSDHAFYEDRNRPETLKQLFNMSDYDPFFARLLYGGRFEQMASLLLGEDIAKGQVEYFNKPAGAGKATPPHQDCYYFMLTPPQAITFWIALEDVDHENGCLHYIKGSHLKGMRPHGRNPTLGFSQAITDLGLPDDRDNEVALPVKAGDVLVHHGMTIHWAGANNSPTRSRRVVGLVYFGKSAKEDLPAKKAYQEQLRKEREVQS